MLNSMEVSESKMEHAMTTTAFTLDDYRVLRTLGVIKGITVRSRSIFGTLAGSLQTIRGGNISFFTELCEKTREEAFETMMAHAWEQTLPNDHQPQFQPPHKTRAKTKDSRSTKNGESHAESSI